MVTFREVCPDFAVFEDFDEGMVYLDLTTDDNILGEGYAREVIRRVQEMRKEMDLKVEERIDVVLDIEDDDVVSYLAPFNDLIKEEVRAQVLNFAKVGSDGYSKEWEIQKVSVGIGIKRLSA